MSMSCVKLHGHHVCKSAGDGRWDDILPARLPSACSHAHQASDTLVSIKGNEPHDAGKWEMLPACSLGLVLNSLHEASITGVSRHHDNQLSWQRGPCLLGSLGRVDVPHESIYVPGIRAAGQQFLRGCSCLSFVQPGLHCAALGLGLLHFVSGGLEQDILAGDGSLFVLHHPLQLSHLQASSSHMSDLRL